MADALVSFYGHSIAERLSISVKKVWPRFDQKAFIAEAKRGYTALNLMQRGRHLAQALHAHLPLPYADAITVLTQSFVHIPPEKTPSSIASFVYLPHSYFIAEFGLDDFDASMQAQYLLTQRFTAEFSIRPFLLKHSTATLARLQSWIDDDSEHVRRLISEGTRPRLPWGIRLKPFQHDPKPVLALLEQLKDDPSEYVRRSVANNLNDIGKDHPQLLLATTERWQKNADDNRQKLIKHALRSVIKQGDTAALKLLNVDSKLKCDVSAIQLSPRRVQLGDTIEFSLALKHKARTTKKLLIDYRIHFVKANGERSAKVFKLKLVDLAAGQTLLIQKRHRLVQMTTRTLYAGVHQVDLLVNGNTFVLGEFTLKK